MTKPNPSWNSGRNVGQRLAFSHGEVRKIESLLRQPDYLHDLCLFMVAVDSFLRCSDVLKLKVKDIANPSGRIRDKILPKQKKTKRNVYPVLSPKTKKACKNWLQFSNKRADQYVFTRKKIPDGTPISNTTYRRLVKCWAENIGLEGEQYSTHSLRRSKPHFMFRCGVRIEYISKLLGHKDTSVTLDYLGITQEEAQNYALQCDIFAKSPNRIHVVNSYSDPQNWPDIFSNTHNELLNQFDQLQQAIAAIDEKLDRFIAEFSLQPTNVKIRRE